jgi:dephospho-CoA kinase
LVAVAPGDAVVVHDVPLLVETGMAARFPLVIVVHADAAVRLRRLVEQRGMAEGSAAARIAAQATDEQRHAVADVWLDNSGTRESTVAAVDRLWVHQLLPFEANLRHHRRARRPSVPIVAAPDPRWPQQAQRVIARLASVADRRARRIDHIGSTAVPGLDARDVLDIQVVVEDLTVAEQLADDLLAAGLIRLTGPCWDTARDGTTRDKAYATNADPARHINCHLRPADSPAWREAVLLRDWLRAHPAGAREYATLKHRLAAQAGDGVEDYAVEVYAKAKAPFVSHALDLAEQWAARTGWQVL